MNNKGFTLVELLAVIIILSLLAVLASTSVTKIVKDSKNDLYDTQIELIKSAAEAWGADNLYDLPDAGTCKYITLFDLKQYGLIDSKIKDPRSNELFPNKLLIKISGEENKFELNNISYEVNPNSIEGCTPMFTCTLINDSDNSNSITPGDKYQCLVKDDMEEGFENGYYFYVLSENDDGTTNLIMDRNMCSDGTATNPTKEDKCFVAYNETGDFPMVGPVTAINFLNNATSTWDNIDNLNLTYDDEGENFTGFKITGKSRLPYRSEVNDVGCRDEEDFSCPVWMTDYLADTVLSQENSIDEIDGYCTFSSGDIGSPELAAYVYYGGGVLMDDVDSATYGVRPVITLKL